MLSVFISYSRVDSAQASAIAGHLRDEGMDVWLDQGGIAVPDVWGGKIVQAINECSTFVLLISPNSMESGNVLKETILSRAMGIAPAVSVCNLYPLDVEQANHLLELAANGGNAGAHCS